MYGFEVAVGELVAPLRVAAALVVDTEMPAPVRLPAVLLDECVLVLRRRLMLAPAIAGVEDNLALLDKSLCVGISRSVQLDGHGVTSDESGCRCGRGRRRLTLERVDSRLQLLDVALHL